MEFLQTSIVKNDKHQKLTKKNKLIDPKMINILEDFIVKNQLICYGGIAINNILPKDQQFYDYDIDIPDYDFFSPNAMEHAKELCDIFAKEGYVYHVEGKSAFFYGTYKVFVNFIPMADITQIDESFYKYLLKNVIVVNNIPYTNPDFLRMSLHQELSRPLGDVSRWEKIYTRMNILNKYFPIKEHELVDDSIQSLNESVLDDMEKITNLFIREKCIFNNMRFVKCLFKKYFKTNTRKNISCKNKNLLDRLIKDQFIIYSTNLDDLNKKIKSLKIENIEIEKKKSKYKFIKKFQEVYINKTYVGIMFELDSCMSFIDIKYKKNNIKIGNIDTLLHLYFALLLMDDNNINELHIKSTISYLYHIINNYEKLYVKYIANNKNHNELVRFNLPCLGKQSGYEDMLKDRYKLFKELKDKKDSIEYKKWFFKYIPKMNNNNKTRQIKRKQNNKTKKIKKRN